MRHEGLMWLPSCNSVAVQDINALIKPADLTAPGSVLVDALTKFVEQNEDPASSPNLQVAEADNFGPIVSVLRDPRTEENEALLLAVLKVLKILSRKYENRLNFGREGCEGAARVLKRVPNPEISAEACNVVLNVCYEKANVQLFLDAGGVPALVTRLAENHVDLQANAAGALQSITYQQRGRVVARDAGAVPLIAGLLDHVNVKVRTRAVGALHNISTDDESIRIIRRNNAIPLLIDMLGCPDASICSSAVGAIQNISREVQSCDIIQELGGPEPLADLLFASDAQAQVSSAGALLNILGHPPGDADKPTDVNDAKRQAMRRLFSTSLVLGLVHPIWQSQC